MPILILPGKEELKPLKFLLRRITCMKENLCDTSVNVCKTVKSCETHTVFLPINNIVLSVSLNRRAVEGTNKYFSEQGM